jgi:hypothetical protein
MYEKMYFEKDLKSVNIYPARDVVPELDTALPPGDDGWGSGSDALAPELVRPSGGNRIFAVQQLNVERPDCKNKLRVTHQGPM